MRKVAEGMEMKNETKMIQNIHDAYDITMMKIYAFLLLLLYICAINHSSQPWFMASRAKAVRMRE
jgi:hypothetical protein